MISNDKLEELLRQLYAQEGTDTSKIVDEEWQKFEVKHFPSRGHSWNGAQIAAAIICVLMFTGITYAAIRYAANHIQTMSQKEIKEAPQAASQQPTTMMDNQDSLQTVEKIVFANKPLLFIVEELARNYHFSVKVNNSKTAALRLYYPWNPQMPLEQIVNELNRFDKVKLTIENHSIIIE